MTNLTNRKGRIETVICEYCHSPFLALVYKHQRFCSVKCSSFGSPRKAMLGKKMNEETKQKISCAMKGRIPLNILKGELSGEKHPLWKGAKVGYRNLHRWVEYHLGKPCECEECGIEGAGHRMHWANKSHKYLRELTDWIRLCAKCHKAFDRGIGEYAHS
jgi:hypothetical protein